MSDDSKPLPCPFCGGEARYIGMGSFGIRKLYAEYGPKEASDA